MATYESYDEVRARLDEIAEAVSAEGVTLDEALALYEEAVKLGLLACDLSEEDAQAIVDAEENAHAVADEGDGEEVRVAANADGEDEDEA